MRWRMASLNASVFVRFAARAYRERKLREMAQEIHQGRVNADLAELDRLRHYLIFQKRSARQSMTMSRR